MNELHEKQDASGLKLITLYTQNHPAKQIKGLAAKRSIKYPIAIQSNYWDAGYQCQSLPKVWVVGVDGKIRFISKSPKDLAENMDKEVAKAMKEIKYRGLGSMDVPESVQPAAKAFAAKEFKKAYDLAEKISDDSEDDKEVEAADLIMEKVEANLSRMTNRFETAEIAKDYYVAFAALRELKAHYTDFEDAAEHIAKLDELEKDETVKKEIAAKDALVACEMDLGVKAQSLAGVEYWKAAQAAYEKVAKDHAGTASGDAAAESGVRCKEAAETDK